MQTNSFQTSFEDDESVTVDVTGTDASGAVLEVTVDDGPDTGYTAKRHVGFTGRRALAYTGHHDQLGPAHAYATVLPVQIEITKTSRLSYAIFPKDPSGGRALPAPGAYVAVDLAFADGGFLREEDVRDQQGNPVTARGQGERKVLFANQWNSVVAELGAVAAGRTVTAIMIDYDRDGEPGDFAGWIDDIMITDHPRPVERQPIDWVDTRRGTNSNGHYSRGNTIPATAVPHGFNFWIPVTDAGSRKWLYHYQQQNNADNRPTLQALALSHLAYPWGVDRHMLQLMPSTDPVLPDPDHQTRALAFGHENEVARPDYYGVTFDNGLQAEIAPTDHAAIFRFTFTGEVGNLIIDTSEHEAGSVRCDPAAGTITGFLGPETDRMYVHGRFDQPVQHADAMPTGRGTSYCRFDTAAESTVVLRIATSRISVEQAEHNLALEISDADTLEDVRDRARALWQQRLGVITDVVGASDDQLVSLYSNLYRMSLYQNSITENAGTAEAPEPVHASPFLPGRPVRPGRMNHSTVFWDTYRTTWPALALLYPTAAGELMDGVLNQYKESGWLGHGMVGSCADPALADLYVKGVRNFDRAAAYDVLIKHGSVVADEHYLGRPRMETLPFLGYRALSEDDDHGGADEGMADALENFLGDYGIAAVAAGLYAETGEQRYKDDHDYFLNRARNYVNYFDPSIGFFQGRHADGRWRVPTEEYEPREWGFDYTETNGWGMAFAVPHDVRGLANLYGGWEKLAAKLDAFFAEPERLTHPGSYGMVIHEQREAAHVQLGQWGLSNQPGFHIPYLYTGVGRPAETQRIVREAMARLFGGSDIGFGYPGDEDTGSMSAWWVFSALGFYPMHVGSPTYAIGSPLFQRATINLPGQKKITISAPQNSPDNVYLQGLRVNGEPYHKTYLPHDLLAAGAELEFDLGPEPSDWGTAPDAAPVSITEDDLVPQPRRDLTGPGRGRSTTDSDAPNTDADFLFDNTSDTAVRWLGPRATVTWSFADDHERPPVQYTLTSAADGGTPTGWEVHGSADGENWTLLDRRHDQQFRWHRQTRPFGISEPAGYRHYRWTFTGSSDGQSLALAEIELLG